jgi:hypothetical protein
MQLSASVRFKPNQSELRRLTRSPSGPVAKMAKRTAEDIAKRARASAPVDSGAYRDSIRVVGPVDGRTGPICSVVSNSPYALAIEYKQRPVLRDAIRNARVIV